METDALILARAAEVNAGLISMLGGGCMRCWPQSQEQYPFTQVWLVVGAIRVGYGDTNAHHQFGIEVRDSDEVVLGPTQVSGDFNVGRPHDLTAGMSQIVPIAVPVPTELPQPGIYSVVLSIDGQEAKRIQFEALPHAPAGAGA